MEQSFLFDINPKTENIRLCEAAEALAVSTATIRNWIKTGILEAAGRGYILKDSLEKFKASPVGQARLTARANKSHKSQHNHDGLSQDIRRRLREAPFCESLVAYYEASLSESYRNKEGIYYTPPDIVTDMLSSVIVTETTTFLDPCCGCGNYILGAIEKGVSVENIYGFDTDANAIEITKRRVLAKTGKEAKNIVCADFLAVSKRLGQTFDLIYTNPPWGKKIPKEQKDTLSRLYGCRESSDSCSLFLFAAMGLLAHGGRLGFLFPESILNIAVFQSLRGVLLSATIEKIKGYGTPFHGVQSKTYAVNIKKDTPTAAHTIRCVNENGERHPRLQSSFRSNPKQIFNIWTTQQEQEVIDKLLRLPHLSLEGNADWGLGVVTGDNKNKCKRSPAEGLIPIFRGKDISERGLATPSLYIDPDLSNCQQVAPLHIYRAAEKIVYRFISSRLIFYHDTEQILVLNSANLLVLKKSMPVNSQQLVSLFNSKIMNWLFSKLFNTHKILRSDLEALPVYLSCYLDNTFAEKDFLIQHNIAWDDGTFRIKG